jgi:transmembrane sensor
MNEVENQLRIAKLISLYLTGEISADDRALLDQWIHTNERNAGIFNRITNPASLADILLELQKIDTESALQKARLRIANEKRLSPQKIIRLWPRIAAAASILLVLSTGGYFLSHKLRTNQIANTVNEIKPGSNGAVLTLANGQKVILGNAKMGVIAQQNGADLNKAGDSLLVYRSTTADAAAISYNILETPRGKQYAVVLPDGTKVWLNAASTLKYPTAFTGKERLVELDGEGLFEVAHNPKQPFKVKTASQTVEDIGTRFNISSYNDDPSVKTTLLEGSVKVNDHTVLKPGEQAVLAGNGKLFVHETDVEAAIAWKNGKFIFDQENIPSVMRKLSRWYNVEVSYNGSVSDKTFTSSISRFDNIQKILDKITFISGVHFKIEGRRIIVDKP